MEIMGFYNLSKQDRAEVVASIHKKIVDAITTNNPGVVTNYFADDDTYIRKAAYIVIGRLYKSNVDIQAKIIEKLKALFDYEDFKVRQSVINAAGEIGMSDFEVVQYFFDQGLFDKHHSPRNAVIGSIKKMGEVNPVPVLNWAKKYLHHEDKEIRGEICHGIELRGRKYPTDILPLLQELQFDKTARVRNTLVHVIGQISYKKGCIQAVVEHLKTWKNKQLVTDALEEIIDVHHRYKDFSVMTQEEARTYIQENFDSK